MTKNETRVRRQARKADLELSRLEPTSKGRTRWGVFGEHEDEPLYVTRDLRRAEAWIRGYRRGRHKRPAGMIYLKDGWP